MPYRVPGGNLVGRIIGLGNLEKLERERKLRRAYMMYNRPMHTEMEQRMRRYGNDRRNQLQLPPSRYPYQESFIPHGLTPNMNERRRHFEPWGMRYPRLDREQPVRRLYQPDVDDWSDERIINYYRDHAEGIVRFQRMKSRHSDDRRLRPHGMKWWVRNYHEYILELQVRDENLRLQYDHPRNGRDRGLGGAWRDDDRYHGGYRYRPRHMDQEDEEDEDF